jgi:hypothetical protein
MLLTDAQVTRFQDGGQISIWRPEKRNFLYMVVKIENEQIICQISSYNSYISPYYTG